MTTIFGGAGVVEVEVDVEVAMKYHEINPVELYTLLIPTNQNEGRK